MKKTAIIMLVLCLAFLAACGSIAEGSEESDAAVSTEASEADVAVENNEVKEGRGVINYGYVKAIWVSQFDMAAVLKLDEDGYRKAVAKMISNIRSMGLNTVILQIRPYGDSFYESDVYPMSRFFGGGYDAVGIFVGICHRNGLSVHAWINPYRLETEENMKLISKDCVVKSWFYGGELCEWEGRYYLDPSKAEVRELICAGAREALTKYDFDGLHMDDYFYPTTDEAFDRVSFEKSGSDDLREFRESSVNELVRMLYMTVKTVDSRLLYGISPAGNIKTVRRVYFADVTKWCSGSGYIDYIMPQVYFGFLHASCPFDSTVDAWGQAVTGSDVRLIIGMTLSKACSGQPDGYAGTDEGKNEWLTHDDIIARSLEYVYGSKYCDGVSLFCYQYLFDPVDGTPNGAIQREKSNFAAVLK